MAMERMLDSLETFVAHGGDSCIVGTDAFTGLRALAGHPYIIEVRRGIAGSRAWDSEPGELHHSTTGELGGLWRFRGQLPNRVVGIGFAARRVGHCEGYRRSPESHHDDVEFILMVSGPMRMAISVS